MSAARSFFDENNCRVRFVTSGQRNLSVDGTGILPSVDVSNSSKIKDYIKEHVLPGQSPITILDVGAGVGHFQKGCEGDPAVDAYSFEGCGDLAKHIVCDPSRFAIVDLSVPFTDERLYKAFDVSTSFEVLEHVHRTHQDTFWNNLKFLSRRHLCGIHVANQEHDEHCTIQNLETWCNYLKDTGKVTVLGYYPIASPDQEVFRHFTKTLNWNCSIILQIDFF